MSLIEPGILMGRSKPEQALISTLEPTVDEMALEQVLCETRLEYLCSRVLGMTDWDKCHSDYVDWTIANKGRRFRLVLMPRGHLKTSIITIGSVIQAILNNPNIRILLASAVWDNSRKFLSEIKAYLTQNRILTMLYGKFESDLWNREEIVIAQRDRPNKTPTIDTAGIEKTVTSQHYDLIVADDLVTRENITTGEQMEKVKNYLRDLLKLLEPDGTLLVVGTRWHDADMYGWLIKSLTSDELGQEAFIVHKRSAIEDGKPIFPRKFSIELLESLKRQMGSYEFSSNYMNEPVDPENQKFKPPVRYWSNIEGCKFYVTVDPAISEKKDSCDGVVLCGAVNGANQLLAVEYATFREMDKRPGPVLEKVFEYMQRFPNRDKTRIVGIESNGYQAVLCRLLDEEMRRRNFFMQIIEIHQNRDKSMRILELTPRWESGNILLKQGMTELEEQILRFPVSEKVDILDTLAMQLQVITPVGVRKPKAYIPREYREVA